MPTRVWNVFVSLMRRYLLGDPSLKYAPSAIAYVLDNRFKNPTHKSYMLHGSILGRLLFTSEHSIIFYPVSDTQSQIYPELSIRELFEKCHDEFVFELFLKSNQYDYLIFPMVMQQRQHWVTLVYHIASKAIFLIDSATSLAAGYAHQDKLLREMRAVFAAYDLQIESFQYVYQGLQKDNVHCGAWTLANIMTIDSFGLSQHLEKIEQYFLDYQNPNAFKQVLKAIQAEGYAEDELDEEYVLIEHPDCIDDFEEVIASKLEKLTEAQPFRVELQALLPNDAIVASWVKQIIYRLQRNIHDEQFILSKLILRESIQYDGSILKQFNDIAISLYDLVVSIDTGQGSFVIKDPGRQSWRFESLGYQDWIRRLPNSLQVVMEALLHDACSFEPMIQYLFGKCRWLEKYDLMMPYMQYVRNIEQQVSLKVVEFLVEADSKKAFEWMYRPTQAVAHFALQWFPQALLLKTDYQLGIDYLLAMTSQWINELEDEFSQIEDEVDSYYLVL